MNHQEQLMDHAPQHEMDRSTGQRPDHAEAGGHGGHGDHAAQFRERFWLSLALTVPVVAFSEMFADLLGYDVPDFTGARWLSPLLGTVIFLYGGAPFLRGAVDEVRSRRPGMMLLISMACCALGALTASTEHSAPMRIR